MGGDCRNCIDYEPESEPEPEPEPEQIIIKLDYCVGDFYISELVPVILPSGFLQVKTWFGNVQDEYGNTVMSEDKASSNNLIYSQIDNVESLITDSTDLVIPYNFPKINFINTDDGLSMTQIVNTFDNNDNLCGYYPDLVRKYVYDKILAYYSNVFGIKNSKYVDILKCILKQQQYSIPNIHLLEKASDNFQNITSGKVSDILKKLVKILTVR